MIKSAKKAWILMLLPVVLAGVYWQLQPFSQEVAVRSFSITSLSAAQRMNLNTSVRSLDGVVLRPGETFSFNRWVGPRTAKRGYVAAPSYLGTESPDTMGGGICLLSSALYQLALENGLRVTERVPHLRTVHTVLPGLDASVWYGQADLKFENTSRIPLQLKARLEGNGLTVAFTAKKGLPGTQLRRVVSHRSPRELVVSVFQKNTGGPERLISRDLYHVAP